MYCCTVKDSTVHYYARCNKALWEFNHTLCLWFFTFLLWLTYIMLIIHLISSLLWYLDLFYRSQFELSPYSCELDPLPVLLEMGLWGTSEAYILSIGTWTESIAVFIPLPFLTFSHFCYSSTRLFASMSLKERILIVAILLLSHAKKQVS